MKIRMTGTGLPNSVLSDVYSAGRVVLPSGEARRTDQNGMPRAEGLELYDLVRRERPGSTLEVGMAFGLSSLFICQALADNGGGHHTVIDPNQSTAYGAMGLEHLSRAGLRDMVEFHEESSHRALPKLEASGRRIDFAFVDGIHLFDYTLVEFFFIDKILKPGGLIVFDDLQLPAVRKTVRYAVTNRGYADESHLPDTGIARMAGRRIKRLARGLGALPRALGFAFGTERNELYSVEIPWPRRNGLAVLRKTSADSRHWTDFSAF